MALKSVLALHPSARDDIADLVTRRPVPGPRISQLDPFLFLNHHGPQVYPPNNHGLPFGPHPHRGFETVTFILAGELLHRDSGGHESVIREGGVQWMTAGAGLIHAELSPEPFKRAGGPLEILQLWVNLPSRLKMTPPRYLGLERAAIPEIATSDGKVKLNAISGTWLGEGGAITSLTGIALATVLMQPGARLTLGGLEGRNVFLYTISGAVAVDGAKMGEHQLAELSLAGDELAIVSSEPARLLLGHGQPIDEPVFAYGPFVMTNESEIRQAIADYQAGKFGAALG